MIVNIRGRWGALARAIGLALAISGCTLELGAAEPARVDRAAAESYLAALQAAQQDALDLWARLIAGEEVSCAEAIPVPTPPAGRAETPPAEPVLDRLSAARSALEQSAARWDLECATGGAVVGLDAARVGQDAAHSATEPLQTAQALIAAWR